MPPIKNENSQHSPYQRPTLQRSDGLRSASCTTLLGDASLIGGSSSSLETIRSPINYDNPQLRPYPSSTTLQSNGGRCSLSFMTSPSDDSLIEDPNYIAEVCLPGHDCSLLLYLGGSKHKSQGRLCRGLYKRYP